MSSRERILELSRKLEKATDKSDESSVLSILQSLTNVNINMQLLAVSGLGKKVNTIRKCKSFGHSINIKETAQQLVTQWRQLVTKEAKAQRKNGKQIKNGIIYSKNKSLNKPATSSVTAITTTTPTPTPTQKNDEINNVFIREEYKWQTGDNNRDKMRSKFIQVLKPQKDSQKYINYMKLAGDIELALCVAYDSNVTKFMNKCRDLHFNLKKNNDLKFDLLLGNMKITKLVTMTSEQLAHKSLKEKRDKARKMAIEEARNDHGLDASHAMTDEYKCYKCGQRKCKYSQAQTRSADEPMTTFVTCLVCGNRWKC
eukprot:180634_1